PGMARHFSFSLFSLLVLFVMAYSVNNLLDKTYGNVGKLTFYTLKSQPVVRRNARFITNPQTEKQQLNRKNIPFLIAAFRVLRPLLIISLNNRPKVRSAYNEFFARNLNHSMFNGKFLPEHFQVSTADIPGTDFQVNRLTNESNKFELSWDAAPTGNLYPDDLLCAAIYTGTNNLFAYAHTETKRKEGQAQLTFNLNFHTVSCTLYLFFVRPDYALSSQTTIRNFDAIN
ncbi:MAG: hypothetical protein P1P88_16210, partial [Bacteroidales bacterium]|nr:hypothetical protein [Bacteroidales bacterium]